MIWTGIHVPVNQVSSEPIVKQVWVYTAKYKNFKFHFTFQKPGTLFTKPPLITAPVNFTEMLTDFSLKFLRGIHERLR